MASFDSVNVRCSFFVNDKAGSICYKIICEGITESFYHFLAFSGQGGL